jgi:hypothetical protein
MNRSELTTLFLTSSKNVLKSGAETVDRPANPGAGRSNSQLLLQMPELARIHYQLVEKEGFAHIIALSRSVFDDLFPGLAGPVLVVRYRITLDCSQPADARMGVALSVPDGTSRILEQKMLAIMAREMLEARGRLPEDQVRLALQRARKAIEPMLSVFVEDHKAHLLTLQSRKRRELDKVFSARMADAEGDGEGSNTDTAREIQREQDAALEHVEDYYDPNSLQVRVEEVLVTLVHRRLRGAKRGDTDV